MDTSKLKIITDKDEWALLNSAGLLWLKKSGVSIQITEWVDWKKWRNTLELDTIQDSLVESWMRSGFFAVYVE